MSAKPTPTTKPTRSPAEPPAKSVARTSRNVLRSSTVGALPILNHFLRRMRLEDFLRAALPAEDRRTKLSPVKALAVAQVLEICGAEEWIVTEIQPQIEETFHQDHRGRPTKDTRYVKTVATRCDLSYRIDDARVALDARSDGIFPLVTNVADFDELELLHAYKRQPMIEKRFSQLKTDFEVAPVYLKAVHRIQAMLCMYFFVLLLEALLERQLRQAMQSNEIDALPMYPEGRACRWPTTRRVIDLFESVQRHALEHRQQPVEVLVTELNRLQRKILKLIGISPKDYGRYRPKTTAPDLPPPGNSQKMKPRSAKHREHRQ